MSPLPIYGSRPCVLLTNDDGPPCASSPNIFTFSKLLRDRLGWDVKVVIPDCQKSWVGKAYAISDVITASYFYPQEPDGLTGDITHHPRPLKDGESMEWILLSGTPATCANIALHNLYPGKIDLVLSGPNHGRNSSTAFALSSGTLGASLAAALSVPVPGPSSGPSHHDDHIPSIAISYGVVKRPVPPRVLELANDAAVEVCERLFSDWGYEDGSGKRVQLYSVNVPLIEEVLEPSERKTYWTNMWRNAYGQLFQSTRLDPALNWWSSQHPPAQSLPHWPKQESSDPTPSFTAALHSSLETISIATSTSTSTSSSSSTTIPSQDTYSASRSKSKDGFDPGDNADPNRAPNRPTNTDKSVPPHHSTTATAGPAALPTPNPASPADATQATEGEAQPADRLRFHFAPTMAPLLNPSMEDVPEGTDAWAFAKGYISVTPLRAEFAGLHDAGRAFASDQDEHVGHPAGRQWT